MSPASQLQRTGAARPLMVRSTKKPHDNNVTNHVQARRAAAVRKTTYLHNVYQIYARPHQATQTDTRQKKQDHQNKKRPQPQGTYADALLRTRPTRPPEKKRPQPQGTYADALRRTRHTRPPEKEGPESKIKCAKHLQDFK